MAKAKVLLGVTGSVAAIKVPELVEQLRGEVRRGGGGIGRGRIFIVLSKFLHKITICVYMSVV